MTTSTSAVAAGTFIVTGAGSRPQFAVAELWHSISERIAARLAARKAASIARFIEANGGELTDDLERQISRRFGSVVE